MAVGPVRAADPSPDILRLAYWHSELSAKGPGLLLRDIRRGTDRIAGALGILSDLKADVLVLGGFDHDLNGVALSAFADAIRAAKGPDYPHLFGAPPNSGVDTGLDLDGDGRLRGARDAQGFGYFAGQGGMAVLSRYPLTLLADHGALLWRDLPDSQLTDHQGRTGAQATGAGVQRLSTTVHWELQVDPPGRPPVPMMIFHATPPVFDGPEDRNGRRNADEIRLWLLRLSGGLGPAPPDPLVVIGTANADPAAGEGDRPTIRALLSHPRLRDPPALRGLPTAEWPAPGPGRMRVDYILPSADLQVAGGGRGPLRPEVSRHWPVYLDLSLLERPLRPGRGDP